MRRTDPRAGLDIPGLALASAGLLGVVWATINGNERGWTDPQILAAIAVGALLLLGFVALGGSRQERRCCRWTCSAAAPSPPPTRRRC